MFLATIERLYAVSCHSRSNKQAFDFNSTEMRTGNG
jgi:hypothetical protein